MGAHFLYDPLNWRGLPLSQTANEEALFPMFCCLFFRMLILLHSISLCLHYVLYFVANVQ